MTSEPPLEENKDHIISGMFQLFFASLVVRPKDVNG